MTMTSLSKLAGKAIATILGLFFSIASSAVTITFDEVQLAPGASSTWLQAEDYLKSKGITLWLWDTQGQARIVNVNHSTTQWMSAASMPNVFIGSNGDPDGYAAFELEFSEPISSFSFVRVGNLARYSPSGSVKGPWKAQAFSATSTLLAEVSEDWITTYADVPNKTFTLSAPGIKSIFISGNSYRYAGSNVPVIDDITYTSSAASLCSGVSKNDVFAFGQALFPSLFSGTPVSGQYGPYDYRYYPGSGNFLGIDSNCMIYLLGPATNWSLRAVVPVSQIASAVTAWAASNGGGTTAGTTGGGTTGGGTTGGGTTGGGTTGGGTTGGGTATPPCTYSISPTSISFGAEGGTGTVNVRQNEIACVVANPPWSMSTTAGWITNLRLGSLSNGVGPGYFNVQANTTTSTRTGTVVVAGNNVTVTQSGLNPLQGQYRGSWRGSCTFWGSVSGSFTMTVTAQGNVTGTFSGSDSGSFSGSVSSTGSLNTASGQAAGGAVWTGTIRAGGTGSSGSWTMAGGCSGSWSIP